MKRHAQIDYEKFVTFKVVKVKQSNGSFTPEYNF